MELDHLVIETSFDLCCSPESTQNGSAPPVSISDSSLTDSFAIDVLDFEGPSTGEVILPASCLKPITGFEEQDFEPECSDEVLFLDLQDWTPCYGEEDPSISSLCVGTDLDPMAALLAFNASCVSPSCK